MNTANKIIPFDREQQIVNSLPEPLTPTDADLTDWPFMPLDVSRLRDSKFTATVDPAAGFFAILLWAAAWHQIPAASLPDDDRQLAQLAGLGRDLRTWESVKADALRDWVKCSDGRYYHPFLAEKALEAWLEKIFQRIKSGRGNAKRWGCEFSEEFELIEKHQSAWESLKKLSPSSRLILKGNPLENHKKPSEYPTGIPSGIDEGIHDQSQGKVREGKVREGKVREGKVSSSNSACAPVPASPAAALLSSSVSSLAITQELRDWAAENGVDSLQARLVHYQAKCLQSGYRPHNPLETFKQACLEDWAKLNEKAGLQGDAKGVGTGAVSGQRGGIHSGFDQIDYTRGIGPNGEF